MITLRAFSVELVFV